MNSDNFLEHRYGFFMMPALALFTWILLISAFVNAESGHDFFVNTYDGKRVEYFWSKPEGAGPFPLLLFIHPEQDSPKIGGKVFIENNQFQEWVKRGFVTLAISQPGYGNSEGSADFCGPKTQQAAKDLLAFFRKNNYLDQKHVYVYGGSRGAVVASMMSSKDPTLAGVILKSGIYDFIKWSIERPWYDPIKLKMLWEIGWLSEVKLRERSSAYVSKDIRVPLLVIHGSKDDRSPVALAKEFVGAINTGGGYAELYTLESEHVIPMADITEVMAKFIKNH